MSKRREAMLRQIENEMDWRERAIRRYYEELERLREAKLDLLSQPVDNTEETMVH